MVVAALTMFLGNIGTDPGQREAHARVLFGGSRRLHARRRAGSERRRQRGGPVLRGRVHLREHGRLRRPRLLSRADLVETFDDLKGLGTKMLVGAATAISMLSLMGIPPWPASSALPSSAPRWTRDPWPIVIGLLTSAISVAYYLRPVVVMFMSDAPVGAQEATGRSWACALPLWSRSPSVL